MFSPTTFARVIITTKLTVVFTAVCLTNHRVLAQNDWYASGNYEATDQDASSVPIIRVSQPQDSELNPVPSAPITSDPEQRIGPPLAVQSNASPEPDYCCRNCNQPWCCLGPRIHLLGSDGYGTTKGGWFQVGWHNRNTRLFNNRRKEANLHQAWLFMENKADINCCDWDLGYRVDGLYGIDAQDIQAFGNEPAGNPSGWDNSWDFGSYGFALPQAYVEIARNGTSLKIGKMFSGFGYERAAAPDNFFYSHTYGHYFTQPFSYTGIIASKSMGGGLELVGGATLGWETGFEQFGDGLTGVGGIRYRMNQNEAISYMFSAGDTGYLQDGYLSSFVYERQLSHNLRYVLQSDWLDLDTVDEFNVAQYLLLCVNDCLALGSRFEWWRSDRFTADRRSTYNFTFGANIQPHANVMIRPEVRVDWGAASLQTGLQPVLGVDAIIFF